MNTEHIGSFRTRTGDDGSLEVWARGWRLESQLYALIPMGIALMFLLAPMSLPMRVVGAGILVGATLFVFRMTKPGLVLTSEAISIVSVIRTQRFPWEQVSGFIGERRHDEARVLMVLGDERQIVGGGQIVFIPPEVYHQLTNVGDTPLVMIYCYGPAGDVAHWRQELSDTLPRAGVDVPPLPAGARPQRTGLPKST